MYTQVSSYNRKPSPPSSPQRSLLRRMFFMLALVAIGLLVFKLGSQVKTADHAAALAANEHRQTQRQAFANTANKVINSNPGITFSVAAIDLNTNSQQVFGSTDPMEAASVGKLLTAALFLHETENRQASLGQTIGDGNAKDELQLLIQQSDDTAWQYFNDFLGHAALQDYAQSLGLASYDVDANSISTTDVAKLLRQLYLGHLLDARDTHLLLSFMTNTNYEDIVTPAVPTGDKIYHKVGLIDDNVNDAAIITSGQKSLVLVVFTDGHGAQNWDQRAGMIQQIAAACIQAYFN